MKGRRTKVRAGQVGQEKKLGPRSDFEEVHGIRDLSKLLSDSRKIMAKDILVEERDEIIIGVFKVWLQDVIHYHRMRRELKDQITIANLFERIK